MPAHMLEGLDPEQRLVAEALTGPVVVLAGAGTGKTRAITHRIAHAVQGGTHSAEHGLAVTYTSRAAGEMRQRLAELRVPSISVRTFHAAALSQLRHFWPTAVGGEFPRLVSSRAELIGQACLELGLPAGRSLVRDLAAEIEWAGAMMVSAGEYAQVAATVGRTPVGSGADVMDLPGVARVMSGYQVAKSQANVIDFEDVLLTMIALIGNRPDIADEIRRRYRWFTVDEYQDITPAQDCLLAAWLGEGDDVCVVGDPSQTIYSFAGASPDALGEFRRHWPGATEVRLNRCYRSTPQIVAVANAVIGAGVGGHQPPAATGAGTSSIWLRSQRPAGSEPEVVTCADDAEEAAAVVARIDSLVATGVARRDIAILVRANSATEQIEVALSEAGIPYVLRGADRFFERPEVREALVRMRGDAVSGGSPTGRTLRGAPQGELEAPEGEVGQTIAGQGELDLGSRRVTSRTLPQHPGSSPASRAESRSGGPRRGPVACGDGLAEQARGVLAGMGWHPAGPASGGAARARWESLAAVLALAEEAEASGLTTMSQLVEEFERRAQLSHAPTADGVTVATLHSAKGLEWSVVFIVGASEGSLPIVHADTQQRIAEERRLFYVGVTRARDRLVVTWALTRSGSAGHRQPSRFLASVRNRGARGGLDGPRGPRLGADAAPDPRASGLVRVGRSGAPRVASRTPPDHCRACGASLVTGRERTLGRCRTCPGNPDAHLAEALAAWRGAAAEAAGVLPSTVLTDVALAAVEERLPISAQDLLAIPGLRPQKLALYGEALLAIVSEARVRTRGDSVGVSPVDASPQSAPAG